MVLWQDVRFAVRLLIKDKWFTLVATLALAFGLGVNATVFTLVNAVLLRSLPVADADRVVVASSYERPRNRTIGVSYLDFVDWSAATTTFTSLAAHSGATMNLSDEGRAPERYIGTYISAHAFRMLEERPLIGRDFLPEDDRPGAPAVVLLGGGVWKTRYASDPRVIGRVVRVNDVTAVIIGVMREGFKFPQNADLWQPLAQMPNLRQQTRGTRSLGVFGRLAPNVTRAQAEAELLAVTQRLAHEHPDTNKDIEGRLRTFNEDQNGGPIRIVFLSLLGAVAFVLLIACANVANLLLARAAKRAPEVSLRVALGASRLRIVRQLLIESLMLSLVSGILGLALAAIGIRLFDRAVQDVGKPYWIAFTFDATVFAYLAAICLGTALIFGIAPALHLARTDVNETLKEGGRTGSGGARVRRWASALVIAELALTLALLAGAGFMMRNFMTMQTLDVGVETSHLLTLSLVLPDAKYPAAEQRLAFYEQIQNRLRTRFQSVSVATNAPMQGGPERLLAILGRAPVPGLEAPTVTTLAVDPRYFQTLGVSVLRGRAFTDADGTAGQDTAIINARFAQMHFPDGDPLGQRITLSLDPRFGDPPPGVPRSQTLTIVGVVGNVRQRFPAGERQFDPVAYAPFRATPRTFMTLLARSDGDPSGLIPVLREEMRAIDPDLPLFNIRTLDAQLVQSRWPFRVFGTMFGILAAFAVLLSSIGLYAVTAYSVSQRVQEIGVRTAIGAQSNQIAWLFLRRALVHIAVGLILGIAGALGVGRVFEAGNLLVQIDGRDPVTIGSIALLLAVVSLAASVLPARRATRLNPLVALRRE